MTKRLLRRKKVERGELMIEASFILVSVMLLFMALLSLAFFFYQEALMTNVANEIAADMAKNFKYANIEMGGNSITLSDVESGKMYRMNLGKAALEKAHVERAKKYAKWRINLATLGINSDDVLIECDIKNSGIGRAYVQVTISQKTDFFLSELLALAGIADKDTVFQSTAYAEVTDLIGYSSMVNFAQYATRRLDVIKPIGDLYVNVKKLIQKLID